MVRGLSENVVGHGSQLLAWCVCSILQTLRVRYGLDMIYTYSSNILIAVRFASRFPSHNSHTRPTT
jgi:hypothetical protein